MKQLLSICLKLCALHCMLYAQSAKTWDISFGKEMKGPESAPQTLAMHNGTLHIGGHFSRLNGNTQRVFNPGHVSYFAQDFWQDMNGGLSGPIRSMHSAKDGRLYVAGGFILEGKPMIQGLAYWENGKWTGIPGLRFGSINALTHDGISLFVGGIFPGMEDVESPAIARYAGGIWHSMKLGLRKIPSQNKTQAEVKTLKFAQGKLYVGGDFDSADMISAKNIAFWDGKDWHSLGAGIPGIINDMVILNNGNVIVASTIQNGMNRECAPLMSWNGNEWSEIGLPPNCSSIQALATDGMNVYVGGEFTIDSTGNDHGLALWDGTSFKSIGGGVKGNISSLLYHESMLYCGGTFLTVSDSLSCRNIAGFQFNERGKTSEDSILKIKTFPNPNQSGMVSISFMIEEPGEAELCLIASDGRIVQCFAQAYYDTGEHEILLNIAGLSSGQYQCSLYYQGNILTTTMHIMH